MKNVREDAYCGMEMETNMFKNLSERTAHQNWKTALLLFVVIASVHFTAAFLKSLLLNLFWNDALCFTSFDFCKAERLEVDKDKETDFFHIYSFGHFINGIVYSCFLHYSLLHCRFQFLKFHGTYGKTTNWLRSDYKI